MTTNVTRAPARLVLQDGAVFRGTSFGASGATDGEVVFNTAMTGYQEVLTDPSYCGQIVTMTYPLIGNYGVNPYDVESDRIQVKGFVVCENSRIRSNFRSTGSLSDYLAAAGVVGIEGIDTRAVTRRLRIVGAMPGLISTEDATDQDLKQRAAALPGMAGQNLVPLVTCKEPYTWQEGFVTDFDPGSPVGDLAEADPPYGGRPAGRPGAPPARFNVVALDYGLKRNILRWLVQNGCRVTVMPGGTGAEEVLERNPDGVFLSNGPGDPGVVHTAIKCIRGLAGKVPIFGICLGHQLIALAFGGRTYKLKFGHRGANQPVKDLRSGKVSITSQNHGFSVDGAALAQSGLEVTQINLNDDTVEGIQHRELPVFAVQYHPEASPGPHDAAYLFRAFAHMMGTGEAPPVEP